MILLQYPNFVADQTGDRLGQMIEGANIVFDMT